MKAGKAFAVVATMGLGFLAADVLAAQVQADMLAGTPLDVMLDHVGRALIPPVRFGTDRTSLCCGLAGMAAVGLFWLYRWSTGQRNWRDGEEYGSAKWSGPDDMAPYTDRDPDLNLQMTATEGLSIDTAATRRNLNVLVIGSSGAGKTSGHVLPNLARANMNYVVTDPKGEIYGHVADELKQRDYEVHRLDLVALTADTKFNPLDHIDPAKPDIAIMRLVTNIMDNTGSKQATENANDGFWDKAERSLLTALTAFVHYLPTDILTEIGVHSGHTLNAVADLAARMEASEQDENRTSEVDILARTAEEIYTEMRDEWEHASDEEHDDPRFRAAWETANGLRFAASQYRPFTQGAGETKKSIIISLGVRLAPIQVGAVREILSDDNLGIERIGAPEAPRMALFLALPDEDKTFNFLAAIFYQCLFDSIIQRCRSYDGDRLAGNVHCFLDEFANVGMIPNFDNLIATIRSRGVSVSVMLQNLAQLKKMYKESWETITGNCDSTLFLGGSEQSTTEWVSKLLGKETIDTRTTSETKGMNGSWSVQYQRTGRELLTPDELAQLDNTQCIYVLRGLRPFKSRKIQPGQTSFRKPRSRLRHSKGWNG